TIHRFFLFFFNYTATTEIYTLSLHFFNDTATTEIYTLSLHDALPIYPEVVVAKRGGVAGEEERIPRGKAERTDGVGEGNPDGVVEIDDREVEAAADRKVGQRQKRDRHPQCDEGGEGPQRPEVEAGAQPGFTPQGARRYGCDAQYGIDQPNGIQTKPSPYGIAKDGADGEGNRHARGEAERQQPGAEPEHIRQPSDGVPGEEREQREQRETCRNPNQIRRQEVE